MCNLYSITTNQEAIIRLFRVMNRYVGNLPPMPGVFPDYPAPVVRNAGAERELVMMRWGMPPPPRAGGFPVTNIRNTTSPHWRGWLKPENRCLVPANSFAEYAPEPNPATGKKDVVWFALNDDRPLFAFGGLWTEFKGDRGTKSKPIPGPHLVSNDFAERDCRADPSQGYARDPDDRRGPKVRSLVTVSPSSGRGTTFCKKRWVEFVTNEGVISHAAGGHRKGQRE
jgi:SOS response associated peptidase (SRAP)